MVLLDLPELTGRIDRMSAMMSSRPDVWATVATHLRLERRELAPGGFGDEDRPWIVVGITCGCHRQYESAFAGAIVSQKS